MGTVDKTHRPQYSGGQWQVQELKTLLRLEQRFVRLTPYEWPFRCQPRDNLVTRYPESLLASRNASL